MDKTIEFLLCELYSNLDKQNDNTPVSVDVLNVDHALADIQRIGLRLQMNEDNQWQLWCIVYFNKTDKIHEGQLCSGLRVFKTKVEVGLWCESESSSRKISEAVNQINEVYHRDMWDIEGSKPYNGPTTRYEVWYEDSSPWEEPWRLCETCDTYEEASQFVFDELSKWSTTEDGGIFEFASYFIYALSDVDVLLRIESIENYNARIEQYYREVRKNTVSIRKTICDVCLKALSKISKMRDGSRMDFTLSDSKFNVELKIHESSDEISASISFQLEGHNPYRVIIKRYRKSEIIDWLKECEIQWGQEIIDELCMEIEGLLREIPYSLDIDGIDNVDLDIDSIKPTTQSKAKIHISKSPKNKLTKGNAYEEYEDEIYRLSCCGNTQSHRILFPEYDIRKMSYGFINIHTIEYEVCPWTFLEFKKIASCQHGVAYCQHTCWKTVEEMVEWHDEYSCYGAATYNLHEIELAEKYYKEIAENEPIKNGYDNKYSVYVLEKTEGEKRQDVYTLKYKRSFVTLTQAQKYIFNRGYGNYNSYTFWFCVKVE